MRPADDTDPLLRAFRDDFEGDRFAQLHADLDAATPMTRTDKAFVLTGIALCIGALVVGAKVAGAW